MSSELMVPPVLLVNLAPKTGMRVPLRRPPRARSVEAAAP
jgi:hypothetical protein